MGAGLHTIAVDFIISFAGIAWLSAGGACCSICCVASTTRLHSAGRLPRGTLFSTRRNFCTYVYTSFTDGSLGTGIAFNVSATAASSNPSCASACIPRVLFS